MKQHDSQDLSYQQFDRDTFTGFRHRSTWLYAVMLVTSLIALAASLILAAETLSLARNPNRLLSCDINAVVSCSRVAQSWQAEFIRFGELSFPNAFFGIAAESVFTTMAVIGLAKIRLPRFLATATWLGGVCALLYAYWLFSQSFLVINALCPWCLVLMLSTTIQCMALTHASVSVQKITRRPMVTNYYRLHYDLMFDVFWIVLIVLMIVLKYATGIMA